jgi:hypothetical protein
MSWSGPYTVERDRSRCHQSGVNAGLEGSAVPREDQERDFGHMNVGQRSGASGRAKVKKDPGSDCRLPGSVVSLRATPQEAKATG